MIFQYSDRGNNIVNSGKCAKSRIIPISPYKFGNNTQNEQNISVILTYLFSLFYSVLRYEPHRFHDGYLQITVKDRGLLGNGIFLGEAFLPLNELKLGDLDQRLSDLPQIQLPLTRPTGYGETFCYLLL